VLMRAALAYSRAADRFAEWTGWLSKWVVVPTIIVGLANVILRYTGQFFGVRLTSNTIVELQWYFYSLIFLLGFAYILKHQINVRVDFWYANMPKKKKAWIDVIGHFVGLVPFALLGIWVSFPQVQTSWRLNEQSPDAGGLPRAPIKTMIVVAFALLLLQAISEVIKLIAILRGLDVEIEEPEAPIRVE
jgi:TRAP-type mannitol/chloroaromatic compound transport system permease small subunit